MPVQITPFTERHAIKSVLFVFEFSRPITSVELGDLKVGTRLHETIKKHLPKVTEHQQIVFSFGNGSPGFPGAPSPQELGGITFEKMLPNGDAEIGLNVQSGTLSLVVGKYSRWAEVLENVQSLLSLISGWLIAHNIQTSAFVLQYLDEFTVAFPDGAAVPLSELFEPKSQYITSNFVNVDGAFHSHHGFFSTPEYEIRGRMLTNIQVNVSELNDSASPNFIIAQVQTTHKYSTQEHIAIAEDEGFSQVLKDAYEYLHQENKKVVGSLLTEPVKAMISFDHAAGRA